MNGFEITLLSGIFYLSGFLSGLGICFKYKKHLLIKTTSQDQLNELLTSIHTGMNNTTNMSNTTNMGPPVTYAQPSAPPVQDLKEVVIRTG